jgi:hypothetical protein
MRLPLQTPVSFCWTNGDGLARRGEGRSRDVSEHGAFVFAPICPPVGASVMLMMALEGVPDGIGPLPVEIEGMVLRIEQSPAGADTGGFAIKY